jgi:hypothetical protein
MVTSLHRINDSGFNDLTILGSEPLPLGKSGGSHWNKLAMAKNSEPVSGVTEAAGLSRLAFALKESSSGAPVIGKWNDRR